MKIKDFNAYIYRGKTGNFILIKYFWFSSVISISEDDLSDKLALAKILRDAKSVLKAEMVRECKQRIKLFFPSSQLN